MKILVIFICVLAAVYADAPQSSAEASAPTTTAPTGKTGPVVSSNEPPGSQSPALKEELRQEENTQRGNALPVGNPTSGNSPQGSDAGRRLSIAQDLPPNQGTYCALGCVCRDALIALGIIGPGSPLFPSAEISDRIDGGTLIESWPGGQPGAPTMPGFPRLPTYPGPGSIPIGQFPPYPGLNPQVPSQTGLYPEQVNPLNPGNPFPINPLNPIGPTNPLYPFGPNNPQNPFGPRPQPPGGPAYPGGLPQYPRGSPQNPGGTPQFPGASPQNPGGFPQFPGVSPQFPGESPQNPGATPQFPGGTPQFPGGSPQNPGGFPQFPGVTPQFPGGTPQFPGGSPQNPGGFPQFSGVNPQFPGGTPQFPGGSPQNPGGTPHFPGGSPQNPGGFPQFPGGFPQSPGGFPQFPGAIPNYPGGFPQGTNRFIPQVNDVFPGGTQLLTPGRTNPLEWMIGPRGLFPIPPFGTGTISPIQPLLPGQVRDTQIPFFPNQQGGGQFPGQNPNFPGNPPGPEANHGPYQQPGLQGGSSVRPLFPQGDGSEMHYEGNQVDLEFDTGSPGQGFPMNLSPEKVARLLQQCAMLQSYIQSNPGLMRTIFQQFPSNQQQYPGNQQQYPGNQQQYPGNQQQYPGSQVTITENGFESVLGTQEIIPGTQQIIPGTQQIIPGTQQIIPGTQQIIPGPQQIIPGTQQIIPGPQQIFPGTQQIIPGPQQIIPGYGNPAGQYPGYSSNLSVYTQAGLSLKDEPGEKPTDKKSGSKK